MLEAHMQLSENDHELVSFADISSIFSNVLVPHLIAMPSTMYLMSKTYIHAELEHTSLIRTEPKPKCSIADFLFYCSKTILSQMKELVDISMVFLLHLEKLLGKHGRRGVSLLH